MKLQTKVPGQFWAFPASVFFRVLRKGPRSCDWYQVAKKKILRCIPSIFKIIIKEEPVFFALKLKTLSKIYIKIEVTVFLEEQALPCLWKLEVCNWHRKKNKKTQKTKKNQNPPKTTKNNNSYMYKPRKSYDIENCKILSKLFTTI